MGLDLELGFGEAGGGVDLGGFVLLLLPTDELVIALSTLASADVVASFEGSLALSREQQLPIGEGKAIQIVQ